MMIHFFESNFTSRLNLLKQLLLQKICETGIGTHKIYNIYRPDNKKKCFIASGGSGNGY
jgi:hypothetical protein